MHDIVDFLFGSKEMMPHGYCFLWNPFLLWLSVISNVVTALAYFFIVFALGFFAYRRHDFNLKWMLLLCSVFMVACGINQVLSVVTIWNPVYGLVGIVDALIAFISVITAVLLWRLIPKALCIPSPSLLLLANKKLDDEILYHQETKVRVTLLNAELDRLLELRTQELSNTQELTQALQASEQRFRTIFEEAPLGIAVIDSLTGNFLDINPRFATIVGRDKEQIIDSDWMRITHPDDIQEYIYGISLLNARKISVNKITKRYIRLDNSVVWVKLSSVPIKTDTPIQYHLQMIEDITETRLAEQINQRMGNILEQSNNEIYIFNGKTLYFEHVNQGGINNLGFSLDELKNMTPLDIKPELDVVLFANLIMPLLNGQQNQLRFETIHQRKNGTRYPVEICLQIYRNDPDYFVAICLDISQRKAHQQKISRLSNFYASLSKINHAIVQINNEHDLFSSVCTIAANLQHLKLAWIGRPDVVSQLIVPVAVAGEHQNFLSNLVISVDPDVPEGQGPSGLAYRENRIVPVNDFQADPITQYWRDCSDKYSAWGASCAIPILHNQKPYAVLNVYSNEKDFFDEDVLKLMAELSLDLSFALDSYAREAARLAAEEKLELSAKVFSQSREAIVIADKDNKIISVNRAYIAITGYEEQDVLGKNPKILASGRQDKKFYRALWESLLKNNYWQGELYNRHKDGTIYQEWLTISVVRDDGGDVAYYIAIFSDITQHKDQEQQIERLAHYDSLTNLPNRRLLKARVNDELFVAERNKKTFALLFVDLDHFKNINDSLGHSIGDQVLIEVGQRLLACVHEDDTVARLGGDEFNILLTDSNVNGAAIVAYKIIASLAAPIFYQDHQLYITPSIGISLYPDNGDSYETLFKNADIALYQAKKQGRNQCQFVTPTMQQQTQRRMEIERDLRQARARNELIVYFQPQVHTQTGGIIGAEALLRWQHPVWGMVPPAEFIPIAEESGLILSIGDWVIEQSIAQARQWRDAGFPLTIAVNLSLAQFRANTLFDKVKQTLEHYQLPAQYLELELTESVAMQNAELAIEITHQLTRLGIKLSIDDFGTGYSSLSYLQRFSLDKLKIDQSFTSSMSSNTDSENIVDAIISLAKSLNLKTIAEGVETKQQLDMFKQKNCDEIQGYYFSKPVPAEQFMALLDKGFMN
ncbi:MAG: EAL domain-containing protein [Methylobacter sp.]|nr:MAG: EAL domain-containing protein [Methylobacter sp.]